MGTKRFSYRFAGLKVAPAALACFAAGAIMFGAALAQDNAGARPAESSDFFGGIGRWFSEQASKFNSNFGDARSQVENFGREAGVAARSTASGAREAADAVAKIPGARVIKGHEKCAGAPNGAPDCVAAATSICKAAGFQSGKSVDMTTSEICPAQVYLSGRNAAACHTETFVSRAFCQ